MTDSLFFSKARLFTSIAILSAFLVTELAAAQAQDTTESSSKDQLVKPSLEPASGSLLSAGSVDKRIRVPTPADDRAAEKLLNNLALQSGWFPELKIKVESGMVSIEGHVKNAEQLAWLAKTADRIPTVVAVINKATVDQPAVTDLTPAWTEFLRLVNKAKRALPLLALTAALLTFFYFISRFIFRAVGSIWGSHIQNPFLLATVTKLSMIPIWMLFFYLALQTAGLSGLATTIIGGTGVLGIVIGFAFKDIAENYLSGLLLAIRSPFTKGDDVSVAGFDGYVQSLNMRGTTILDYDGNLVLIPNSMVITSVIRNRTTSPNTRVMFTIGIGYSDSVSRSQELILQAMNEVPAILKDPAPFTVVSQLTSSTVNLNTYFWLDTTKNSKLKTLSAAIARSKELLLAEGISLPDDAREVVFTDALKIQLLRTGEQVRNEQSERKEAVKRKATSQLGESKAHLADTSATHEEEMRQLGSQVDMLERSDTKQLLK